MYIILLFVGYINLCQFSATKLVRPGLRKDEV